MRKRKSSISGSISLSSMLRRSSIAAFICIGKNRLPFALSYPTSSSHFSTSFSCDMTMNDGEFDTQSSSYYVPETGWTHNQPKKWNKAMEKEQNDIEQESDARTGWLHNTKAPSKEIEPTVTGSTETVAQRLLRLEKIKKATNHRMISPPTFHTSGCGKFPMVVTEHKIAVPLTYSDGNLPDDDKTVDVFFTIVEKIKNEEDEDFFQRLQDNNLIETKRAMEYVQYFSLSDASKMIIYLQGGPGFGSPSPVVGLCLGQKSSWMAQALHSEGFERVVLMDQRGTGRSSPITKQTLNNLYPELFILDQEDKRYGKGTSYVNNEYDDKSNDTSQSHWMMEQPEKFILFSSSLNEAVNYMSKFRADSIVKDAESIKRALLQPPEKNDESSKETPRPWGAALGQSFGGFCMMSYLSLIPNPPKICLLTGGIAPMLSPPLEVYKSLFQRVKERNFLYYEMYPGDIQLIHTIVAALLENPVPLPSGGILTARRFLQVGIALGGSPSSFASLHCFFNSAILDQTDGKVIFSKAFLKQMDSIQPFDDHPIYFLLHESIYADGQKFGGTNWAAYRAFEEIRTTMDEFRYEVTSKQKSNEHPTMLLGEMVFPWMADGDFAEISGFGMKSLAQAIARKNDWSPLYDADAMRKNLSSAGSCKAAAAVYFDDMYVDFDECMKVAKTHTSPLAKCKLYITNDYQHSGLRDDGATIFSKLLGMARGTIRTPS